MAPLSAVLLVACLLMVTQCVAASSFSARSAPGAKGTTCPCGMSNKGRIVGGSQTLPNAYPWIVMLVQTHGLEHICGASIINEKVAITAAHCTYPTYGIIPLSIIAGSSDVDRPGQIVPVAKYIDHEDYDSPPMFAARTINDISLLILARPLKFNPNVGPVCLPTGKVDLENKWIKIVGWGKLGGSLPAVKKLREVDVQVKPFLECKMSFPFKKPQTQFCTKTPGKGACMGDSGGPLVMLDTETNRYTLVGVVSFGSNSCDPAIPTAATEVSAFLPWIKSKINSEGCHKV